MPPKYLSVLGANQKLCTLVNYYLQVYQILSHGEVRVSIPYQILNYFDAQKVKLGSGQLTISTKFLQISQYN